MKGRAWFADAAWLTADRAQSYARVLALGSLAAALYVGTVVLRPGGADVLSVPLATDFVTFWAAGGLAAGGHAASVYTQAALQPAEQAGSWMPSGYFPFFYPPIFLLLCLPLALLGYLPAFAAFIGGTYALIVTLVRRLLPPGAGWVGVITYPAFVMNALIGQNGFVSAACFAGAALWLTSAPILGGACLALLAFKPHLALCVPVALLAARRWTALVACATAFFALALLSNAMFGWASWQGFFASAAQIRDVLQHHKEDYAKLLSIFSAVRMLGGGLAVAYAAQAAVAVAGLAALVAITRHRPGAGAEIAALVAAAMLCTPHLMDYDLACLAIPLAWVAGQAMRGGWLPGEKSWLTLLYLWPLAARALALHVGIPLTPCLMLALLWLISRRVRAYPG